jgi:hypothetical protein
MAVALRIADVFDRPGGPDHAGSGNVGLWDLASIAQRRFRSANDAIKWANAPSAAVCRFRPLSEDKRKGNLSRREVGAGYRFRVATPA